MEVSLLQASHEEQGIYTGANTMTWSKFHGLQATFWLSGSRPTEPHRFVGGISTPGECDAAVALSFFSLRPAGLTDEEIRDPTFCPSCRDCSVECFGNWWLQLGRQETPGMFLLLLQWISNNKHAFITESTFWEPIYGSFLNIICDSTWTNRSCPVPWIGMIIQQHVEETQKWKKRNVMWCLEPCTHAF